MSKIKILSPAEICKIAAGEVVERPANIVKELVENALDAGATKIEIQIFGAGKKALRVIDNGCGMSHEDAKICFLHHATSKISGVSDLDTLSSFGFRGEALSSIAAVSKVELITAQLDADCGSKTILIGGELASQVDFAGAVGTDLLVTDLFYNTPARKKFLKKDETEWHQIVQLFYAFVFDYQAVQFKLYHDDRLIHNCPPVNNLSERVLQIWDASVASRILTIEPVKKAELKISGVISDHQLFRYNRAHIFCFVNRRLVKNHGLVKALLKGYSNVLPAGRYPLAILFIDLPYGEVDINVHPRKEEVSFLNPRKIENLICEVTKKTLETKLASYFTKSSPQAFNNSLNYTANIGDLALFSSPARFNADKFKGAHFASFDEHSVWQEQTNRSTSEPVLGFFNKDLREESGLVSTTQIISKPIQHQEQALAQVSFVERNYEIIGQFRQTYILISNDQGLSVVDQHAAHERVLYEKFKKRFNEVVTVNLMFPVVVMLAAADLELLKPHLSLLKQHGLNTDVFGNDQIIIHSTPTYLKQVKLDELIRELIGWIKDHLELDSELFFKKINEQVHAQMACKAAVKAGDILASAQMYELLDDLYQTDNCLTCPHGRPVMWSFNIAEIEKKFKRKL